MFDDDDCKLDKISKKLWLKKTAYSIREAIILLKGYNPEKVISYNFDYYNNINIPDFDILSDLILNDIKKFQIQSTRDSRNQTSVDTINLTFTIFQKWLQDNDIESEFFETTAKQEKIPAYLDINHECYCPKLALAIDTHNYLVDNKDTCKTQKNHTLKKVAEDYFIKNASRFGLDPNNSQLKTQIAMIVNFENQDQEKQKNLEILQELSTSS